MSAIFNSLHYSPTQDNPPQNKSNALLSSVELLLEALIFTYECQQSVSEIPPPKYVRCRFKLLKTRSRCSIAELVTLTAEPTELAESVSDASLLIYIANYI